MGDRQNDDPTLFKDSRGIPTLFDVVVPGDRMRAAGYRLSDGEPSPADVPEADHPGEHAQRYLQERIRHAIEMALPPAMERAVRDIPRILDASDSHRQERGDDRG